MTQLHGPRSGDLVRARRRHHLPAGPPARRLHPDRGLLDGRGAPGRLPLGDEGQGARRADHPRRPALLAHEPARRPARADPRGHRHRVPRRPDPPRARDGVVLPRLRRQLHERLDDHQRALPGRRGPRRRLLRLRPGDRDVRPLDVDVRGRRDAPRAAGVREHATQAFEEHDRRRHARRRGAARRHARSTRAASSRSCAGTSAATRPRWSSASAASRRRTSTRSPTRWSRTPGRERTTAFCYARRLDAAHRGRADDPHRGDPPAPARQHRPARRRDPGAARPRVDPGLDRHPDALRPAARATCTCRTPREEELDLERYIATGGADRGWWSYFDTYIVSLLKAWFGDAATAGQRLRLLGHCRGSPATTRISRR